MKRFLLPGVLLLCLMSAQMARAAENRNAKIKAEMVENYLLWQEAYKTPDAERIISFESPDFTHISDVGKVSSKDENDQTLREGMIQIYKAHNVRIDIKKLNIEQNRVVVWSKHYFDGDLIDPQKKLHRVVFVRSTKDIWVQYDEVWMLKRVEELGSKWVVDGKPITS